MRRRRIRVSVSVVVLASMAAVLSGCQANSTDGSHGMSETTSSSESPAPSATAPELNPNGDADENQVLFDAVNKGVIARSDAPTREDFVDALVTSGFEREDIEVTRDVTTVGNEAESVQLAVLWDGECLLGQYDPPDGAYTSTVADVLSSGRCLLGETPKTQS